MTDEELLDELAAGGPSQTAALSRLYHGKGREFGRFFVSRGLSRQDADDVLQETILKILQNASSFRGAGSVNAWMWQIARNCLIDCQRQQAKSERGLREFEQQAIIDSQPGQVSSRKPSLDDALREQAPNEAPLLHVTGKLDPARLAEDCVAKGLARFAIEDPERAYAIELVVEGVEGHEIADRIGRKYGATREYLSQCRQHLAPYIRHCLALLAN